MKQSNTVNARLSLVVLFMMITGMVLAACGGGAGGTNTPAATNTTAVQATMPAESPTAAVGAESPTAAGTTPDAGGSPTAATTGTPPSGVTVNETENVPKETATLGGTTPGAETPGGTASPTGTGSLAPLIMAGDLPAGADPNGQFVHNLALDPSSTDPQVATGSNEIPVMSLVFQGLLNLDENNQPTQNSAESYTVSEDGKTYTFKIREGITYSDGQPLTAKNFEYSLKRLCDPVLAGGYSYVGYDIVGCEEYNTAIGANEQGTPNPAPPAAELERLRNAVGVKATDDRTLQINLKKAASYFPYIMALWVTYPARQDLVEKGGDKWWSNPQTFVGNGPFKLVSYQPKQQWVFERNENYFRGKPHLARITMRIVESPQQALLGYQQGQLDSTDLSADNLTQVEKNAALKDQIVRRPYPATFYIGFNNAKPPFNKLEVRQAFAYAMNRDLYNQQVNAGVGTPAYSFIPPGIPGHQEQTQQKYDPERAKQLLAQGGFQGGQGFPALKLPFNNQSESARKRAEFWAGQWKEILGVNITATPEDGTELFAKIRDKKRQPELYILGWIQDFPHPQNWVSTVFSPTSAFGPAGWKDPEFLDLITRADQIGNIEEAAPLYAQADARLTELAPAAFYAHDEDVLLISPKVKGYVPYGGDVLGFIRQAEKIYKTQ